jgi:hypothetical protein
VTEPSAFDFELFPEKLKIHKFSAGDNTKYNCLKQELGKFILRYISLLIILGMKRSYEGSEMCRSVYAFVRRQ